VNYTTKTIENQPENTFFYRFFQQKRAKNDPVNTNLSFSGLNDRGTEVRSRGSAVHSRAFLPRHPLRISRPNTEKKITNMFFFDMALDFA